MHLMYWLEAELKKKYSRSQTDVSTFQQFVYTKAAEIEAEASVLFSDDAAFTKWAIVWDHCKDLSFEDLCEVRADCVAFALEACTDCHMRFVLRIQAMDYQLMWLVYSPPHARCAHRKTVAAKVLQHFEAAAHLPPEQQRAVKKSVAWKCAYVFDACLRDAAKTGTLYEPLWRCLLAYSQMIASDTQDIEGINGIVKRILNQHPNLNMELLNSRVLGKKTQGVDVQSGNSSLPIQDEVDRCLANHQGAVVALRKEI